MKLSRHFSPRTIPFVLLATTLGLLLSANEAHAQARSGGVVGINMKYLVDSHQGFQGQLDGLRQKLRDESTELTQERQQIERDMQQLRAGDLDPTSEPYQKAEEELARGLANWQIKAKKLQRNIQQQEAQLLQNVYTQITNEVQQYAAQHGIAVVVQFVPPEPGDVGRQGIQASLTHPIVHVNQHFDITGAVLAKLNAVAVNPNPQPRQ